MKLILFIPLIIISTLSISATCGHIFSQPTEIVPQNALSANVFYFYFMLETSLIAGDFLYIKFPFAVGNTNAVISPSLTKDIANPITTTAYAIDNFSLSDENDQTFYEISSSLASSTWYQIKVTISGSANEVAGVAGCVWFATTSSQYSNWITYDENRCFDVLSFAQAIDTTSLVAIGYYLSSFGSSYKTPGSRYEINLDVKPTVDIIGGGLYIFTIASDFVFISGSSVSCLANSNQPDYCPANITALATSQYTCTIDRTNPQKLTFEVKTKIYAGNFMRFRATVMAPSKYIATAVEISVDLASRFAPITFFRNDAIAIGSINGIDLKTDWTVVSGTAVVTLFWGLVPTTISNRAASFSGCPINLYSSGSVVKIFNSFKSTITPSSEVRAYSDHNYFKAIWKLVPGSVALLDTVVETSLSTNFPGTLTIDFSNVLTAASTVTIAGITSLSILTPYWIGIKFSLSTDILSKQTSILTMTNPNSINCGAIQIATNDAINKLAGSYAGVVVQIRAKMEYGKYGIWQTWSQIYVYWSTDDLSFPPMKSIVTYLYSFFSKNVAIWAKPTAFVSGYVQSLLIHLIIPVTAICTASSTQYSAAANYYSDTDTAGGNLLTCMSMTAATASLTYGPEIRVLLKIGFNNKILNLEEGASALKVGGLFPEEGSTTEFSSTAKSVTDTNKLSNTISGDSNTGLYYLSMLCQDVAVSNGAATKITCYSAPGYKRDVSFSGLSFINTQIYTLPTPYADQFVLDFLICFKISKYKESNLIETSTGEGLFQMVEEGCTLTSFDICDPVAGPSVINGYVISGPLNVNHYGDYPIVFGIVNGYYTTTASAPSAAGFSIADSIMSNYIPAYLRVKFTISSAAKGENIGLFLNGPRADSDSAYTYDVASGLLAYADSSNSVNIIDAGLGTSLTAIVNRGPRGSDYLQNNVDLWFTQHCIVIQTVLSNIENQFYDFYIPIQISFITISSIHVVALGSKTNLAYSILAVYRSAGSFLSNFYIIRPGSTSGFQNLWDLGVVPDALAFDKTNIVESSKGLTLSAGSTFFTSSSVFDVRGGCFGTAATEPKQPGFTTDAAAFFRPNLLQTSEIVINTNVENPGGSKCILNSPGNLFGYGGQAFILYMRDSSPFFTSANIFEWSMKGTDTITNKCIFHNIKKTDLKVTPNTFKMIYTLFCMADFRNGVENYGGSNTITFAANSFRVPFYWGAEYLIRDKLNYAWSNKIGNIVSYNGEKSSTAAWKYTSLCLISDQKAIPYSTFDAPLTITITGSNGVTYTLANADYLTLTLKLGNWNVNINSVCSLLGKASVDCVSSNLAIILTNNQVSSLSLTNITINTWIDTNNITFAETVPNTITITTSYNSGADIEVCTTKVTTGGFMATAAPLSKIISISTTSFSYLNNNGARGPFSFSFSYSRIVRAGYFINLKLGSWITPTTTTGDGNFRCLVLESGGGTSHKWSTITPIDAKSGISTLTVKTEYNTGGNWNFKCLGGNTKDESLEPVSDIDKMQGILKKSNGISISDETVYFVGSTPTNSAASVLTVSLVKTFLTLGFDSDYTFSFIPAKNYTMSARFIVEFSQAIPPKLNSYGVLECYVNEIPAYCTFNEERRVVVWTTISLSSLSIDSYNVKIAGVTQPNFLTDWDTNQKIWFAIDSNDDLNGGVDEAAYVSDQVDSNLLGTISSIFIHNLKISSNKFRSFCSFIYVINLPPNSLTNIDGNIIWVTFPVSIRKFLFYGGVPSISFVKVVDSNNVDLVKTVQVFRGGRIAFSVEADKTNTEALNYTLTIGGVSTPDQGSIVREDFRIFLAPDNITVTASTASGCRNTTTYITWDSSGFSNQYTLNWANSQMDSLSHNPVVLTMGTYQLVFLFAQGNFFRNTFNFNSTSGINSSSFQIKPAYQNRVVIGSSSAPIYIGTKIGIPQGRYFIPWTHTDSSRKYSKIPTLDIVVSGKSCNLSISGDMIDVPLSGGISEPIIIDFSMCVPLSDVSVLASLITISDLATTGGLSFSGFQNQTISLSFTDMSANYKMYFYVSSNSSLSNESVDSMGAAFINFTMGGTNGANINAPKSVLINLISTYSTYSDEFLRTITPFVTNSNLFVGCDQNGLNYFAVGTNANAASYNVTTISAATELLKIDLTEVDPEDAKYISLGYIAGVKRNVLSTMSLAGHLKAAFNLTIYTYCRTNNLNANLTPSIYNWIQDDNGGQTVVLTATFYGKLTSAQKVSISCALVKILAIKTRFVLTDEGADCKTLRLLQDSQFTTNTSNNTNTNTNTANTNVTPVVTTAVNTIVSTNFYVLKNYLASVDNTSLLIIALAAQTNFLSDLISSLNDTTFPALASSSFTVTPVILNSDNANIIPVVVASIPDVDYESANITFNLTNLKGLVYAGIIATPISGDISLPNNSKLIQGYDGNNTKLIYTEYIMLNAGEKGRINFTGLVNSTNYTIYYAGSNLDISIDALVSEVQYELTITSTPFTDNLGNIIKISMLLLKALLIVLFGVI